MSTFLERLVLDAERLLAASVHNARPASEQIARYQEFVDLAERQIEIHHRSGAGGIEVAQFRSALIDALVKVIFQVAMTKQADPALRIALVATGGYGRATLNPRSDIDLLFLLPRAAAKLPKALEELVQGILYPLWDMGFKVGNACRSITECIEQAKADQENKTALMDARCIIGDASLFEKFQERFAKECIQKGQEAFFDLRTADLKRRHAKYSHTVFLQEPNVKESCGGLRDFHNILWIARAKIGTTDLQHLVDQRIITANTRAEIEHAHDFLHRVRNELHYETGTATDILTLQLQGVVANSFGYPQRSILRRTEEFMRDYYRHTRHIYQHAVSLMETFEIDQGAVAESGVRSFLTFRSKKREQFDGLIARDGRVFPARQDIFKEDINRLMRLFQHTQLRGLRLSPPMRRLIALHWEDIDRSFRYAKANRETFQAILERKGQVAKALRQMHRAGFLGRYLPEFGALDCLVQHEFFHRYTADEHTLRCVEQLDALVDDPRPERKIYRRLLHEIQDPYGLYLAVILHDTGRAENVREHTDGSALLASKLCNRLEIRGARRSLIVFLVDNHLLFWRTATSRNLDDPEVIAEFAAIVKSPANLDALLLFTYADSKGTSPEGWSSWKESLMLQLHRATHRYLSEGREGYVRTLDAERLALRDEVMGLMREDYRDDVSRHFERMPDSAFHFRQAEDIVTQVRTVRHFLNAEADARDPRTSCIKWIDHTEKGYTEMVIATWDKPLLLEKLCCAFASEQLNILSADLFTRSDGVVVNLFRVCTTNFEPVASPGVRGSFVEVLETLLLAEQYEPERFLKRRMNFLKPRSDQSIAVPVRAAVSNDLHPLCTTVEIQAIDRIGLLHDLFHTVNKHGLNTAHARICTEKGVAMDTLYITTAEGGKVVSDEVLQSLESAFAELVSRPETRA